jgi:glyoxylase-like metal-dependent hydrolase (beta-lactamase superfamily II)
MNATPVGSRGTLFTFEDLGGTNVYIIEGARYRFICDTFLGPDPMEEIKQYTEDRSGPKPYIVFNSHADWDHIWGNCAFRHEMILAHRTVIARMGEEAARDLARFGVHKKGPVELVPPTVLFDSEVLFLEEGVRFFHTPGHTEDSSSCLDLVDGVLFVGDNLEEPVPYVSFGDVQRYIETLRSYAALAPVTFVPGHGSPAGDGLLQRNLDYLLALSSAGFFSETGPAFLERHRENLAQIARFKSSGREPL